MAEITHGLVEINGIQTHIAEAGTGPQIVRCHGFPESWYSWRHQITALADAGWHVAAQDARGYGQAAGVAEHELQPDGRRALRMLLFSASGNAREREFEPMPARAYFLEQRVDCETLPPWLRAADLDSFTAVFERTGFRGPLDGYRNIDANRAHGAAFQNPTIRQSALFTSGDRDLTRNHPMWEAQLRLAVPGVQIAAQFPGIGHWTRQEAPAAVNAAMRAFLATL